MATNFGISLQFQALTEVNAWLEANANGRTWDVAVIRYRDEINVPYHRHQLLVDDDAFAIQFKFDMGHHILPNIPPQPIEPKIPRDFYIRQTQAYDAITWIIENVQGVDWSVRACRYKGINGWFDCQLITIHDDAAAVMFKLANSQYMLPTP